MSSHRREENSVTEMSGSDEMARSWHGRENRQIIGCSRTQSRPSLKYACSTQSRNQMKRRPVHLFNRSGIGALVKTCFFHRRADQNASIASWYKINFRRANHMPRRVARTAGDREHLAFHWTRRKPMRTHASRPGTGAVHDDRRSIAGLIGAHAADAPV